MPTTGDPVISFPGWELQQDEYSILSADSTLSSAGWSVYDWPPQTTSTPYIVIGEDTDVPVYHKSGAYHEITTTLHLYSSYKGKKQIKQAVEAIVAALTGGSFSLSGFKVLQVSLDSTPPIIREGDGDPVLHHGIPRFRYLIQET